MKRSRGRGRRSGGGNNNNPNKHFESNGPGVKIRGSAQQILEKYQQYARDAQSAGNRVDAENYLQHAEHYYRVLAEMKPPEKPKHEQRDGEDSDGENDDARNDGDESQKSDEARENKRPRGRGRSRRDRDDRSDRKNDNDPQDSSRDDAPKAEGEVESVKSDKAVEAPATDASIADEKPKRRRTYKKREAATTQDASGDEGDDGVMKTLSRGRKKAAPKAEPDAQPEPAQASEPAASED